MTNLLHRSALVVCLLTVAAQAGAAVTLLSQSRSVSGRSAVGYGGCDTFGFNSDDGAISAPDFGPFEEEVRLDTPWYFLLSSIATTQNSEIQTDHFSIHGSAAANVITGNSVRERVPQIVGMDVVGGCTGGGATGESDFEVLFEVSTPTSFSLGGSLASTLTLTFDGSADSSCSVWCTPSDSIAVTASLQLDRDGAPYLSFYLENDNDEIAVSEVGILEPGTYSLTVNASTDVGVENQFGEASAFSSFDFDFFLETTVSVEELSWSRVKAKFR